MIEIIINILLIIAAPTALGIYVLDSVKKRKHHRKRDRKLSKKNKKMRQDLQLRIGNLLKEIEQMNSKNENPFPKKLI